MLRKNCHILRPVLVGVIVLVTLVFAAADASAADADNRIYIYDFQGMLEELKAVRKKEAGSSRQDVSATVEKHIPSGRPVEELFSALHNHGFRIYTIQNEKAYGLKPEEDGYSAILHQSKGLFWSLGLMSDELVIRIVVRGQRVVRTTAAITLLHP